MLWSHSRCYAAVTYPSVSIWGNLNNTRFNMGHDIKEPTFQGFQKDEIKLHHPEPDSHNRKGNVLEKEKIMIRELKRLHILKERCRALPWEIALEENLH